MINVTKSFLPPIQDYITLLEGIWKRSWLTNNGPLVNELELKLKEYLDVPYMIYVNNGTIALQIAIRTLELKGEVITTPFSFIATTSSLVWEGCKPVFVDIDHETYNLDPTKIEEAITPETSAILATHVFGNPCDIDAIDSIAKKHKLKVIYDAAHCFGTKYKGKSVFRYGDIAISSFHATKIYHTIEGGALFTKDAELLKKMSFMRNFGFNGPEAFSGVGINGKNSEFHAAMGLVNLRFINEILEKRRQQCEYYKKVLKTLKVNTQKVNSKAETNCSYFPILFDTEEHLLKSLKTLTENWIYPRRYFYPSLTKLPYLQNQSAPICEDINKRILCLPLYHDMEHEEQDMVARLLLRVQNN